MQIIKIITIIILFIENLKQHKPSQMKINIKKNN